MGHYSDLNHYRVLDQHVWHGIKERTFHPLVQLSLAHASAILVMLSYQRMDTGEA